MKSTPCIIIAMMLFIHPPTAHALFGHVAAEKDRRVHAEQQFEQQQRANEHLHIGISILSAGVVTSLIIGAAIGSKTKRDHGTNL